MIEQERPTEGSRTYLRTKAEENERDHSHRGTEHSEREGGPSRVLRDT